MTPKNPNEKKRKAKAKGIAPTPEHPNLNRFPLIGNTPPIMGQPNVPPPLPPIVAKLGKGEQRADDE